jgi:hypothetical protein
MWAKYRRAAERAWEPVPVEFEPDLSWYSDVPPFHPRPERGDTTPVIREEKLTPIAAELRRQALYSRWMKRKHANASANRADSTSSRDDRTGGQPGVADVGLGIHFFFGVRILMRRAASVA